MTVGRPTAPQDLPRASTSSYGGVRLSGSSSDVLHGDGTWGPGGGGGTSVGFASLVDITGLAVGLQTIALPSLFDPTGLNVGNRTTGGSVTQLTDKTTGVTIDSLSGQITTAASALGGGAEASFTVTCAACGEDDVPVVAIRSGGTAGAYQPAVSRVAAGSFDITITNLSGGSLSEAIVLNYRIIEAE